jgi:hypothetical protein
VGSFKNDVYTNGFKLEERQLFHISLGIDSFTIEIFYCYRGFCKR